MGGDDCSMTNSHDGGVMMDDDNDDDGAKHNNNHGNNNINNSFSQIQSRRFQRSSSNNVPFPCFGSFCPSMDLIALGMRSGGGGRGTTAGSNILDGLLAGDAAFTAEAEAAGSTNNDDDECNVVAESIVVHRILSWQSLLHLKIGQLTSTSPDCFDVDEANNNTNNEEHDNDNHILCTEDIERGCIHAILSATTQFSATVDNDEGSTNRTNNDNNASNNTNNPPSNSSPSSIRIRREEEEEGRTKQNGATCIIWSPDGRYIAIGLLDGGVLIQSVESDAMRADGGIMARGGGGGGDGGNRGTGGLAAAGDGDEEEDGHPSGMHVIRPPPPSSSSSASSLLPPWWKQRRHYKQEEQERPVSFSPRVTRSMAEKREGAVSGGKGVGIRGEETKQSITASSLSSPEFPMNSSFAARVVAPVVGMTWNQLLPLVRRRRRHDGQRLSYSSPPDDNGTDEDQYHEDMEDAKFAEDEMDIRESWRYTSQLIEKGAGHFLPNNCQPATTKAITFQQQNGRRLGRGRRGGEGLVAHLNVMCVATTEDIHLYLQGQYRILSIPHGFSSVSDERSSSTSQDGDGGGGVPRVGGDSGGIDMVCSPDLSTLLAVVTRQRQFVASTSTSTNNSVAKLFRTTLLPRQRFELQFLSASYRSLFSHLWDARRSFRAVYVSWKSALRPLDVKFSGLVKLLSDYGVKRPVTRDGGGMGDGGGSDSIRLEFLRFILSGRSSVSRGNDSSSTSSTSAALDQFFTRPQMHDMLLQKEFRGVEVSLSSTEVLLRSRALHSIRAVVYEAEELYGIACAWEKQEIHSSSGDLVDVDMALNLYNASRQLYLSFNQCLGYIVEARTRVRDLLAWIRGTAARVRAWGTAPDSIQRKNAKALRVSNGVLQRVAAFLSSPMMFALKDGTNKLEHRSLTECIIGVPLSDFLVQRKLHQTSMAFDRTDKRIESVHGTNIIRNLGSIVKLIFQISTILFEQPRHVFAESVSALDICFEIQHSLVAIHTRRGASRSYSRDTSGYFLPKSNEADPSIEKCPSWMLLARLVGSTIELIAIPRNADVAKGFFLRAVLLLPEGCEVTNISFYGDDGHSSLSPNLNEDAETKEGRQAIGFVVKCTSSASQDIREELWITPYDDLTFKKYEFKVNSKNEATICGTNPIEEAWAVPIVIDDAAEDTTISIYPKRRTISTHQSPLKQQRAQLSLCGPRGTGGVVTFGTSIALNILDLEEDENCSSEFDDE